MKGEWEWEDRGREEERVSEKKSWLKHLKEQTSVQICMHHTNVWMNFFDWLPILSRFYLRTFRSARLGFFFLWFCFISFSIHLYILDCLCASSFVPSPPLFIMHLTFNLIWMSQRFLIWISLNKNEECLKALSFYLYKVAAVRTVSQWFGRHSKRDHIHEKSSVVHVGIPLGPTPPLCHSIDSKFN